MIIGAFVLIFMIYSMVFLPLLNWVTSLTDSIDAKTLAIILTLLMVTVSGFGAYFQLRLFWSFFIKDPAKNIVTTQITLAVFYAAIVINMGVLDTINKNAVLIESSQKSIHNLNEQVKIRPH